MSNTRPPTKIQKEILDYVVNYFQKHGYSPTLKEIARDFGDKNITTIHQHIEALKSKGYISKKENSPRSLLVETTDQVTIPLVGTIAAGNPIGVFEDPLPIQVPKSMVPQRESYYALRVSGDSMIDEGIWDEDLVIIRQQSDASPGDIVVAIVSDEFGSEYATLKVYYPRNGEIELKPKNKNLKSIFVKPQYFEIRGLFKGLLRQDH